MKTVEQIKTIPGSGIIVRPEGGVVRLFFDIEPVEVPEDEEDAACVADDLCHCYNVDVTAPVNYGSVIAAIVNDRFSADDVQAMMANVTEARDADSDISAAKREEYIAEWGDYQAWRAKAKEIAAYVTDYLSK